MNFFFPASHHWPPTRIFGLITEPGENTTVFTMFGTQASPSAGIDWIIIRVDLAAVFKRWLMLLTSTFTV